MAVKCPNCGEETTQTIRLFNQNFTVTRLCRCGREEKARTDEAYRQYEANARKRQRQSACFSTSKLAACEFSQDNSPELPVSKAARRYAERFPQMLEQNMGLLFYGPPGIGKTFYAACIANAVLAQGYSAAMTNFTAVVQTLQSMYNEQYMYVERLAGVSLLILDDLGAERSSEYMQEQVYNVIDARYRARKPLIITTNLPIEEIKAPAQLAYQRIYDRVLGMCHPVKLEGPSRRREELKQQYAERNRLLGLE